MRPIDVFLTFGWPVLGILVGGVVLYLLSRAWDLSRAGNPAPRGGHRMVHALGAPIIGVPVLLVCGYFAQMQWRSGGDTALALGWVSSRCSVCCWSPNTSSPGTRSSTKACTTAAC